MRQQNTGSGHPCWARWHRVAHAHATPSLLPGGAGVSLAANAVVDHLLGDRLASPLGGALGVLLVATGVALCSLAQHPGF